MPIDRQTFAVVSNTREEWHAWRASSTPVFDAAHSVLEVLLVLGWAFRYITHLGAHAAYLDGRGRNPDYQDSDFRFNALVWPVLEPINWRQETLMRGATACIGLAILSLGINPRVTMTTDMTMLQLRMVVAFTQGGYLLLDPVLGVAQRLATR